MNPRLLAARIIDDVTNGKSLSEGLSQRLNVLKDPRDRSLVQAMVYGVCRYYARLDVLLSHLLKSPMKEKDSDVHAVIMVGLYQLIEMRIPPHAAVAETVNAAIQLKKDWARGFVNAILREYLRHQDELNAILEADEEAKFAHPAWWISAIKKAWPQNWETILNENNAHPPFSLRVNRLHLTRDAYLAKIENSKAIPETQNGMMLAEPMPAEKLPGFAEGDVFVQDGAAQLAAELLKLAPQQRVLDACAAPGGKLTHLLEIEPNLAASVAVEKDPERMSVIKENLARLKLSATCLCADAADTKSWWDGQLFDRILLDAPCSASGVIRRHPDIKLLRQPGDFKNFAREQERLLSALWPLLKPGGILLYVTCSIFPEENTAVVKRFLTAHPDAKEDPIDATWGIACEIGRQILPGMHAMDGFYYARIVR